jgi:hypothetical protein
MKTVRKSYSPESQKSVDETVFEHGLFCSEDWMLSSRRPEVDSIIAQDPYQRMNRKNCRVMMKVSLILRPLVNFIYN